MTLTPRPESAPATTTARQPALIAPRPHFSASSLWMRGLVAACGAILAAVPIALLVRGFTNQDAFQGPGGAGNPGVGALSAGAFTATLLVILALHVLIYVSPRPFVALNALMVLGFLLFAGLTWASSERPSEMFGSIAAAIPIAIVVRLLVGWAGHGALGEYE
jgi:hypothetical protein